MGNTDDKIDIYVSKELKRKLEQDAIWFEVYNKSGEHINFNGFITRLILGYYREYLNEEENASNQITASLKELKISENEKKRMVSQIIKCYVHPFDPLQNAQNTSSQRIRKPEKISWRPSNDCEGAIVLINERLKELNNISRSEYYGRLLISYSKKTFSEREKIIFSDIFKEVSNACKEKKSIIIKTIWDTKMTREVIAYTVVNGPEEMHNYLLCVKKNENGMQEAMSIRLNRIANILVRDATVQINEDVRRHLELMQKYGPAYAINKDSIIHIRLTEEGVREYRRIYWGRPEHDGEPKKQKDGTYFTFRCSEDQVFFYFRRFDGRHYDIIEPDSLRQRLVSFHEESYRALCNDTEQG